MSLPILLEMTPIASGSGTTTGDLIGSAIMVVLVVAGIRYVGRGLWARARGGSDRDSQAADLSYGSVVRYRMPNWWRLWLAGVSAVFAIVAVALVTGSISSPSVVKVAFCVAWLAIGPYVVYSYGWRVGMSLTLEGDQLVWSAPMGEPRALALADIVAIRPWRARGSIQLLELASGDSLLVYVRKGFVEFVDEIAARRPLIPIELSRHARLCERSSAGSGFSRAA